MGRLTILNLRNNCNFGREEKLVDSPHCHCGDSGFEPRRGRFVNKKYLLTKVVKRCIIHSQYKINGDIHPPSRKAESLYSLRSGPIVELGKHIALSRRRLRVRAPMGSFYLCVDQFG